MNKDLSFSYPEPPRDKRKILPVFIPFSGCPSRCIYCAQHLQTGSKVRSLDLVYREARSLLSSLEDKGERGYEVAFFGGTFTGLSSSWIERFLTLTGEFREKGVILRVRCSTRPDFIDKETLSLLKGRMELIELGIQSFNKEVLRLSGRGYTPEVALSACEIVKEEGFSLGIQLLPGLPGFSKKIWRADVNTSIFLSPDCMRIYPCVVLKGTELARWFREGKYNPLSVDETIRLVGWAVFRFWRHGIRVIRIGLHNQPSLEREVVAGPWDSSFGSQVRGYILSRFLYAHLLARQIPPSKAILTCPGHVRGEIWGRKGRYRQFFEAIGMDLRHIHFKDVSDFSISQGQGNIRNCFKQV